jgi:hypothetical protein
MSRIMVLLLVGIFGLAGLLGWQWIDAQGKLRNVQWQPPAAIKPEFGSVSAAGLPKEELDTGRFVAIVERPLFSPTRRPPLPPKVVVVPPPDPLDTAHLYGIFSGAGGGGIIVRLEGQTRRVKVGDQVGDWRLKEIRGREAIFARGGDTRTAMLMQAKQVSGNLPPPPVAIPRSPQPTPPPRVAAPNTPAVVQPNSPANAKPSSGFVIGGSR